MSSPASPQTESSVSSDGEDELNLCKLLGYSGMHAVAAEPERVGPLDLCCILSGEDKPKAIPTEKPADAPKVNKSFGFDGIINGKRVRT